MFRVETILSRYFRVVKFVFSRYYVWMKTNRIYNSVERLAELLKVGSRQAGAAHGLQPVQLEVLNYLSSCNKYSDTPMAVTEYLGQTKGTVSQTIKTLEKKELVKKITDEKDKRISHVVVTQLGSEILKEHLPTHMFVNACSTLSDPEQEQILSALTHLLTSVIKSNNMKTFGACYSCRYNIKHDDGSYYCDLVKEPLRDTDVLLICREHKDL
ncbi:MAG: DNA-binding MarR family transcriptional regulator [Alteromonadaceae bacterium]|jgi:DNA-binding MarR family transcriptional regulator